jgi:hypothetical protein
MAGFDIVHVVTGYYDGVLDGIADYMGGPHRFEIVSFDGAAGDRYELTPLSEQAFAAAMEAWEIWQRWEVARRAGGVPDSEVQPHPGSHQIPCPPRTDPMSATGCPDLRFM